MSAPLQFPPQCPLAGCTARLLGHLRAHGCRLYATFGRSDGMLWFIETPTPQAAVVAEAHLTLTRVHEVRLLMLLQAEIRGLN